MKTIFLFLFLFVSVVANGQMIHDVINDMLERIYDDSDNKQDSIYIVNHVCDLEFCYTGVKPIKIGYPYYIDSLRYYSIYIIQNIKRENRLLSIRVSFYGMSYKDGNKMLYLGGGCDFYYRKKKGKYAYWKDTIWGV